MGKETITIQCHKGAKEGDMTTIEASKDTPLLDVRKVLEEKKFITPDSKDSAYRFIFKKTKAQKMKLDDLLVSINTEEYVPVNTVLGDDNQLILTDWLKKKSPDLVGFGCNWWYDRYLSVRCTLNDTDPTAQDKNKAIKAFPPIMLTDVIPTSKNIIGIYNNVLVCLEGSVVEFHLNSWGAAGYSYRITTQAGEPIVKSLNHTYAGNNNRYEDTSTRRWQSSKKTIEIHAIDKLDIGNDKKIAYQKLTFKSCNIISYETKDGKGYHSDSRPPILSAPGTNLDTKPMLRSSRSFSEQKQDVTVLPGDSIAPATPTMGEESTESHGTIYKVTKGVGQALGEGAWDDPLGAINVFLFVFKSYEEAMTVIQALNTPDPNIWK